MSQSVKNFTINLIKNKLNIKPWHANAEGLSGLSDHHPMMMYGLYYAGASKERISQASKIEIDSMYQVKTRETDDIPPTEITRNNFKDYLGKFEQYYNFYDFFEKEKKNFDSNEDFLKYYLNIMPSFLYSEAFHGVIRLEFFREMGIYEEYHQILSEIACSHFEMIECEPSKKEITVSDVIQTVLENREHFENVKFTGIITDKMMTINNDKIFSDLLSHPIKYEGEKTLQELLDFILKVYWITDDFTIMHGLNSFYAFSETLHLMKNDQKGFQIYFTGVICAFITTFQSNNYEYLMKEIKNIEIKKDLPSFEKIFEVVAQSDDEHDAKTVYALHNLFKKNPNNLLLQQKAAFKAHLI